MGFRRVPSSARFPDLSHLDCLKHSLLTTCSKILLLSNFHAPNPRPKSLSPISFPPPALLLPSLQTIMNCLELTVDSGDYVTVTNALHVHLSGNKSKDKIYRHYSGFIGGLKEVPVGRMKERRPEEVSSAFFFSRVGICGFVLASVWGGSGYRIEITAIRERQMGSGYNELGTGRRCGNRVRES